MDKSKTFYGWWVVVGSAIMLAVLGPAAVAVANIYQAPVVAEFGISNSQFAISNSLVLGVGIFLSPFVSKRLSTGNFKRTYIISFIIYALAYIGFGFATNIYVFYILSLFVGYGFLSTTILPVSILISNWFISKRGLALSLAFTGLGIGGVIFSQLVTFLINSFGWSTTYKIYGLLMLIVILPVVLFIIKVKPQEMGLKPYGAEEVISKETTKINKGTDNKNTSNNIVKTSYFMLLIVGAVFVGISKNSGLGQFPPVLASIHGDATAATIISIYSAVGILGKIVLGHINDLHGSIKSTIYATFILALSYFFMLFSEHTIAVVIMAILFGMGNAIGTVLPPLITAEMYNEEDYSIAYGYVNSGVQLGMTVGSLFAAGIADLTGSYNYSWMATLVLCFLIAILWVTAVKQAKIK